MSQTARRNAPAEPVKGLSIHVIRKLVEARQPGMWAHLDGLSLVVGKSGSASWSIRYSTKAGARRVMTISAYEPITAAKLKALEADAAKYREAIRAGADPLAERRGEKPVKTDAIASSAMFEEIAREYIADHKSEWKNEKHADQWEMTLEKYVFPIIGAMRPDLITTDDVLSVLKQSHEKGSRKGTLWNIVRETASRTRSRIEIVIGAAKAKGLSDPATRGLWSGHVNPAAWSDNLEHWLNGKQAKTHFEAMPFEDVPAFVAKLSDKPDFSARALMLTILCWTWTSETLNATWDEFDLEAGSWSIPAERMKMGRAHNVPLSPAALDLLKGMPRIEGNPFVFPGAKRNRPLSNMSMLMMLRGMHGSLVGLTVHGFRSSARDWCAETTLHPDTIAEMALAHTIKDGTVRAYRRGDAYERRKTLMEQWADYLMLDAAEYKEKHKAYIAAK